MSFISLVDNCGDFNHLANEYHSIKRQTKIQKKIHDQYTKINKKCFLAASKGKYCCRFDGYIPQEIQKRLKQRGFGVRNPDPKDFYSAVFWYDWQVVKSKVNTHF